MGRIDVTQSTVLERVVTRLRDQLKLNPRQCFQSLQADSPPEVPVGGDFYVAVAPGFGRFPDGEQIVGNITENWSVVVTGYTRVQLDSAAHHTKVLHDTSRGLLEVKRRILKALVGHDAETTGGDTFLRQLLYAISCSQPQVGAPMTGGKADGSLLVGWISLTFGVDYDWDLT